MKKLILPSILAFGFSQSVAFAQFEMVRCYSTLGTDHDLSLVIVNSALREIRTSSLESNRAKALIPRKVMNQSTAEKKAYIQSLVLMCLLRLKIKFLTEKQAD